LSVLLLKNISEFPGVVSCQTANLLLPDAITTCPGSKAALLENGAAVRSGSLVSSSAKLVVAELLPDTTNTVATSRPAKRKEAVFMPLTST
jgi:hypothetical protein